MRKREVEAQLHSASLAHKRLADFVPIRRGDFQSPLLDLITEQPPTSRGPQNARASTEIIAGLFNGKAMLGCRENEGPTQIKVDNAGHC
jgi:hypothetical protein